MNATVVSTAIGVLAGGLITWIAAHVYYRKAGTELTAEAAKLTELITISLAAMEQSGWASLTRDASGRITGYKMRFSVAPARAVSVVSAATMTTRPPADPAPPESQ